jgi:hypothetical protein
MEDRETPRLRKYGESETTQIMMATYRTSLPERDVRNTMPVDFCSTVYKQNK